MCVLFGGAHGSEITWTHGPFGCRLPSDDVSTRRLCVHQLALYRLTMSTDLTAESLAQLLREAEHAHGAFERELGHRDDDWPTWYATYIVGRLNE
jgi:hypothetical protein